MLSEIICTFVNGFKSVGTFKTKKDDLFRKVSLKYLGQQCFQSVIKTERFAECTGDSIEYFCNSIGKHSGISYQWYYNGNPIGVNKDKIKIKSKNNDSVQCVVINAFNCPIKIKYSDQYILNNYPINTAVIIKDSQLIAVADNVKYFWYDCDSSKYLNFEQNKSFKPKKSGNYSVIIKQRDCFDTSNCMNIVLCNPQTIINGKDTVCKNTMNTYSAIVLNAGINYRIRWYLNNSFLSINPQINIIPKSFDSIYYTLIPDSQCFPSLTKISATKKIYQTIIDRNLHVKSNVLYTIEKGTYQWLHCDSNFKSILNQTKDSFTPFNTGFYSIEISKNGCKDTSGCYIYVKTAIKNYDENNIIIYQCRLVKTSKIKMLISC
ncbi:MAG: hypothetical protein ACK4WA_03455 [Chitinophagales bacterium]